MPLHPWWTTFGEEVGAFDDSAPALARELAALAAVGYLPGVGLMTLRLSTEPGYAAIALEVDVERPQDLAYPIRANEPIVVVFPFDGGQPSVLSLRPDFPDTPHQNWALPGGPFALCIDDRPWAEAQLTASAREIARRIQLWLAKAARGELHDAAQPPDPLFFGSQAGLILPASALGGGQQAIELAGMMRSDNSRLIISRPAVANNPHPPVLTVLAFQAQPQEMARLRHAPDTLAALAAELEPHGIDLVSELKARLKAWRGLGPEHVRRLGTRLAIVVAFPVRVGDRPAANDLRAFLTDDTAGEIGVGLGVLYSNSRTDVGDKRGYMLAVPERAASLDALRIMPVQVHLSLDRDLAAAVAGRETADRRRALLVGAGSLGSQLSVDLAREGAFAWTVVDDDQLLPHNLVRHALYAEDIGAQKADALATKLSGLLAEPVDAIVCNIMMPDQQSASRLAAASSEADVIIDATASVAASRHISDLPEAPGRRICAFFNPAGTAVVLLAEGVARNPTLRDLEAQYYRLVLTAPSLVGHLATEMSGVRYSGSCRALTNRISGANAAILSALAAKGAIAELAGERASVTVWSLSPAGEVARVRVEGAQVQVASLAGWTIVYDGGLLDRLAALRSAGLPNETGGVLLGVVDHSRKAIHIAHALPAPADSLSSRARFERGVVGLADDVGAAVVATMHQLRYIGEWHSHPDFASAKPSPTDVDQLRWLGQELEAEGLPGLIAIAGQDGRFTFSVLDAG